MKCEDNTLLTRQTLDEQATMELAFDRQAKKKERIAVIISPYALSGHIAPLPGVAAGRVIMNGQKVNDRKNHSGIDRMLWTYCHNYAGHRR